MHGRSSRLGVLAALVVVPAAVFCGVAQADDNDVDDSYGGHSDSSYGSDTHSPYSDDTDSRYGRDTGSNGDRDDDSYRSRGGRGGEPGENSAECGLAIGPGNTTQCGSDRPAERGADGPDRVVF